MRIGKRKVLGAAAGIVIIGIAIAAWFVGGSDSLLAIVLATVLVGLAGVGYMVAQSERRTRAHVNATVDQRMDALARDLNGKLQRPGEQFEALLRAMKASHVRLEEQLAASIKEWDRRQVERMSRALHEYRAQIAERQGESDLKMVRQFKHSPAELDALMQVHRRLRLGDPLPLMGGWALSPRGMLQAIELVDNPRVSLVVECGSGTSTLFLARVLQLRGTGKLIALEHLPEYVEKTQAALKQHGLDGVAEVRHAPLEEVDVDDTSYMWYSPSSITDLESADVIVVDGPPQSTGTWARYPAYPLLRHVLSDSGVILIDDIGRSDERSIVDAWLQMGGLVETAALSPDQVILQPESRG